MPTYSDGILVPVVLFPRFTTLVGANIDFATLPLEVSAYDQEQITFWRGPLVNGLAMYVVVQESNDRDAWSTLDSFQVPQEEETPSVADLSRRWFRVVVRLSPSSVGVQAIVSCWAQGSFVRRRT